MIYLPFATCSSTRVIYLKCQVFLFTITITMKHFKDNTCNGTRPFISHTFPSLLKFLNIIRLHVITLQVFLWREQPVHCSPSWIVLVTPNIKRTFNCTRCFLEVSLGRVLTTVAYLHNTDFNYLGGFLLCEEQPRSLLLNIGDVIQVLSTRTRPELRAYEGSQPHITF